MEEWRAIIIIKCFQKKQLLGTIVLSCILLSACVEANWFSRLSLRNRQLRSQKVKIDADGFLSEKYEVCGETRLRMIVRQVPGDGSCLFHAINLCLGHVSSSNGTHPRIDLDELNYCSQQLREETVDLLSKGDKILVKEGDECFPAKDLVAAVAAYEDMDPEVYLASMRQPTSWGGGPELLALANLLRRPVHVYELAAAGGGGGGGGSGGGRGGGRRFALRRCARYGSPAFDAEAPLHVLSADSRFPNLVPGEQLPYGNHFLALFPCNENEEEGEESQTANDGQEDSTSRNEDDQLPTAETGPGHPGGGLRGGAARGQPGLGLRRAGQLHQEKSSSSWLENICQSFQVGLFSFFQQAEEEKHLSGTKTAYSTTSTVLPEKEEKREKREEEEETAKASDAIQLHSLLLHHQHQAGRITGHSSECGGYTQKEEARQR